MKTKILWNPRFGVVCGVVITAMVSDACAPTPDGRKTQQQGTAIGAVAGGVLGALIGSRNRQGAGTGALTGAAIGGLAGFAYGTHVANQKAKYKSTEDWLDACIAAAEKKRQDALAYNNTLDKRLAQLQREVQEAKAKGDQPKLKDLKKDIVAEQSKAEQQVGSVDKEIELQQGAVKDGSGSSRSSQLRAKLSSLGVANESTKKLSQHLAQLGNSTGV